MSGFVTFSDLGRLGGRGNGFWQSASTMGIALDNNMTYCFPLHARKWGLKDVMMGSFPSASRHKEQKFEYEAVKFPVKTLDYDLKGYFQSHKYFWHHWDKIKHHFEFDDAVKSKMDAAYGEVFKAGETAFMHIRRGDFLKMGSMFTVLPKEYYEKALTLLPDTVTTVFCFSDDMEWCMQNLHPNLYYVHENEMEDMYLMSQCDYGIIANSSYSAWATILNKKQNKKVFAPPKNLWFGKAFSNKNLDDMYFDHWQIVNF